MAITLTNLGLVIAETGETAYNSIWLDNINAVLQALDTRLPLEWGFSISDETTTITTGTAKMTLRSPNYTSTITAVRASLTTASSSGIPTFDINENGTTILSTKLTIDQGEKTSVTAATPVVISDNSIAADSEITIDIDVAGTGAKGAKIYITWSRA